MSERNRQKLEEFKAIASDESLTDDEIRTYLSWAKGKVDVALNYYFNRIEKGGAQPVTKRESMKENNRSKQESLAQKKLREGAEKEKRTEDYIRTLKEEYKLPLRTKDYQRAEQHEDIEFAAIDYIPDVLYSSSEIARQLSGHAEKQYDEKWNCEPEPKCVHSLERMSTSIEVNSSCDIQPPANSRNTTAKEVDPPTKRMLQSEPISKPSQPTKVKQVASSQVPPSSSNKNANIYLGEFTIGCFAVSKMYLPDCHEGDSVQISIYHLNKQAEKSKKGGKKKPDEKIMMRVVWKDREIGRVEDSETKFLNGLLDKHILLQTFLIDKLEFLDHFKTFRVRANVTLRKESITAPIVQTYENRADNNELLERFGAIRENLMALFARLNLVVSKQPLIRLKSKYNATKPQPSKPAVSVPTIPPHRSQPEKTLQQIHHDTVNNPFRQEVQRNISDMFSKSQSSALNPSKPSKATSQGQLIPIVREVQIKPVNFSQLIDLHEEDLDEAQPDSIFISKLHEYQSLALSWMLRREGHSSVSEEETLHPMWLEYALPEGGHLYFNEFTGQIAVDPPIFKSKCKGGILADEMGLGKTVMLIALMATNRSTSKKFARNLIVLPLTLLEQWDSEISVHTKPKSLKVLRYYETGDRTRNLLDYDVVLTTYGVISQEFAQGNHVTGTGLYRHEWHRVILDEAHYIKGRVIQTARAVFSLRSQINWCLTGTPIQNKLDDLFALLHFIRYTPWSDYQWWNSFINKPHEEGDPVVFEVLRTILKRVLLRRTKQSRRRDGEPIIRLPEKTSKIAYVTLSSKERQFYDAVYESSKKEFDELADHGIVEAKFMKIFEILMRLRQICCHPALFRSVTKFSSREDFPKQLRKWLEKRLEERNAGEKGSRFEILMEEDGKELRLEIGAVAFNENHFQEVLAKIDKDASQMCAVCLDPMENPVITVCLHTFCKSCIVRSIESIGYCPECRGFLARQDFTSLPRENRLGISLSKEFRPSSKMEALMSHLRQLQNEDKAVVFSQFLGMIDLVEEHMRKEGITYVVLMMLLQRMDGSLSQKERTAVIQRFRNDPRCSVFIISLKSGGVGLNLVVANRVFLVDPWWNPAVEEQAIERVHRIGQKKRVEVVRFIVENSIESRMMELHESKRNISAMAMSERESKETSIEKFRYLMARY